MKPLNLRMLQDCMKLNRNSISGDRARDLKGGFSWTAFPGFFIRTATGGGYGSQKN